MKATFFKTAAAFRSWLVKHHATSAELWVGFYRKASGRGGITYPQALDEALCFGWIDGLRKGIDGSRYTIRFTPRTPRSTWSRVNIRRARELKKHGRMRPPGWKAFQAREPERSGRSPVENLPQEFNAPLRKRFLADRKAWNFFQAQPPGYRRKAILWVMSAKREETRQRRLAQLMAESRKGRRPGAVTGAAAR